MTRPIDSLRTVASDYDAIVFDQWGVMHNGTTPYPGAVAGLEALRGRVGGMAVLSNSGKRAALNAERISAMGFDSSLFDIIMTGGEALWLEIAAGRISERAFFAVERGEGDAEAWASGLDIALPDRIEDADAVLLMGVPDGSDLAAWESLLKKALERRLTMFCANPDRGSPRAEGIVISPGALASAYRGMGGAARSYGKPHRPVFEAVEKVLGAGKILMVGDSFEHDVAGAQAAGWDSLLIRGGIHADAFAAGDPDRTLRALASQNRCRPPTYRMETLR